MCPDYKIKCICLCSVEVRVESHAESEVAHALDADGVDVSHPVDFSE